MLLFTRFPVVVSSTRGYIYNIYRFGQWFLVIQPGIHQILNTVFDNIYSSVLL